MTIYTTYLSKFSSNEFVRRSLHDVILEIKSDIYYDLVKSIRAETDKSLQKKNKLKLPQFFPTVVLDNENKLNNKSISTGIVQFDIDKKNNVDANIDELKKIICNFDETIYAFDSPSGGIKFGILTDFTKYDYEELHSFKNRFEQAYRIVFNHVSNYVKANFDECVKP